MPRTILALLWCAALASTSDAQLYAYESVWASPDREFVDCYLFDHPIYTDTISIRIDTTYQDGNLVTVLVAVPDSVELAPRTTADHNRLPLTDPLLVIRTTTFFATDGNRRGARSIVRSVRTAPGIDAPSRVFARWDCGPRAGAATGRGASRVEARCAEYLKPRPPITWQAVADLLGERLPLTRPVDLTVPPGEEVRP